LVTADGQGNLSPLVTAWQGDQSGKSASVIFRHSYNGTPYTPSTPVTPEVPVEMESFEPELPIISRTDVPTDDYLPDTTAEKAGKEKTTREGGSVLTGDSANLVLWILIGLGAGGLVFVVRKRENKA
jgi:hypothetical protein